MKRQKRILALIVGLLLLSTTASAEMVQIRSYPFDKLDPSVIKIRDMDRYMMAPDRWKADSELTRRTISYFDTAIAELKKTHDIPVYVYLVETVCSHAFRDEIPWTFPADTEMYQMLKSSLHADAISHLEISSAEQLFSYFYTTDMHWNYRGSYRGYLDCAQLLGIPEEERYVPTGEKTFPVIYNGALAKIRNTTISQEQFTVYTFDDFPDYTAYVNGKKKTYDHYSSYMAGKYESKKYTPHYDNFYGGNYSFVVLESQHTDAPDLLVIGNSFTNPVKTLLAHHYHRVVCVNLFQYKYDGRQFSLSKTVEEYGIDQILLLSDIKMYAFEEVKPRP